MITEQDLGYLTEVFALARIQTVTSQPNNRQMLENIMNFEVIFKNKIIEMNKKLVAPAVAETAPETSQEIVEPTVKED